MKKKTDENTTTTSTASVDDVSKTTAIQGDARQQRDRERERASGNHL